jgi:TPR repeat protein
MAEVAQAYEHGRGARPDQRQALAWARCAADDARAPEAFAHDAKLRYARLLARNPAAVTILEQLAGSANAKTAVKARYLLGRYYRQCGDNNTALEYLRPLADEGHGLSLNDVARIEFEGGAAGRETWERFLRAGEKRVPGALMNIATFYDPQRREAFPGITKCEERAVFYYSRAADLGLPPAILWVARRKIAAANDAEPSVGRQLRISAYRILKQAADLGDKDAQLAFGRYCVGGEFGEVNLPEGLNYLLLVAEKGSTRAMRIIASVLKTRQIAVEGAIQRAERLEERANMMDAAQKR